MSKLKDMTQSEKEFFPIFLKQFINKLSLNDLFGLSDRFHDIGFRKVNEVLGSLPEIKISKAVDIPSGQDWHTLIDKSWTDTSGEYIITPLKNKEELEKEGDALDHCVGSYSVEARAYKSIILSVQDKSGRKLSTVELTPESVNLNKPIEFSVNQHFGRDNTDPSLAEKEAVKSFIQEIENGKTKLDPAFVKAVSEKTSGNLSDIIEKIGFDPVANPEGIRMFNELFNNSLLSPYKNITGERNRPRNTRVRLLSENWDL